MFRRTLTHSTVLSSYLELRVKSHLNVSFQVGVNGRHGGKDAC